MQISSKNAIQSITDGELSFANQLSALITKQRHKKVIFISPPHALTALIHPHLNFFNNPVIAFQNTNVKSLKR